MPTAPFVHQRPAGHVPRRRDPALGLPGREPKAGTDGGQTDGTVDNANQLSDIVVQGGDDSIQNNFGDINPSSIAGRVCVDVNGNGQYDAGEPTPSGVTINLLNAAGSIVASTQTRLPGEYSFTDLVPGTYSVQEEAVTGYFQEDCVVGTVGGTAASPTRPTRSCWRRQDNGQHYDFCLQAPASVRQILDLYACVRPVKYYAGVPSPVKHPERMDLVHLPREHRRRLRRH